MKYKDINDLIDKNHILPSLSLEITSACNLKCVHCFVKDRCKVNTYEFLSLEQIKSILKQAFDLNVFKITLTGGEPFLHPQIVEILEEIKRYNFICYILTNGTLISDHNIQVVKKCAHKVFLSNYGFTKETYEAVTNKNGSFLLYNKAINLLKSYDVPHEERIILLKENEIETPQFVESGLKIETCICGDQYYNHAAPHRPSDNSVKSVYCSFANSKWCQNRDPDDFVCNVGCSSLTVKATGDVTPCNNYGMVLGHIEKDSIRSLWEGNKLKNIRERSKFKHFKTCMSCPDNMYSVFLLPCNNYQENGDSCVPSSETCRHCRIIKEVLENKERKNELEFK